MDDERAQLITLPVESDDAPLPPRVDAFLRSARELIDGWFARPDHQTGRGFVPSDYVQVWSALAAVRRTHPDARNMLEWGSGFGVIVGLGALLGFESHGIEIEGDLNDRAIELLTEHELDANVVHGSFVPTDFEAGDLEDPEANTAFGHPDAYDELGLDLDDFDLVFAYPWPTEEELYREIFRRHADYGAILLTSSRLEGMRLYQKT